MDMESDSFSNMSGDPLFHSSLEKQEKRSLFFSFFYIWFDLIWCWFQSQIVIRNNYKKKKKVWPDVVFDVLEDLQISGTPSVTSPNFSEVQTPESNFGSDTEEFNEVLNLAQDSMMGNFPILFFFFFFFFLNIY